MSIDRQSYHWVAAVNLGFFQNLWARVGNDDALEVSVFDYRGQRIVSYHPMVPNDGLLAARLADNVDLRQRGIFDFGDAGRFMVAYRGSSDYPMILIRGNISRPCGRRWRPARSDFRRQSQTTTVQAQLVAEKIRQATAAAPVEIVDGERRILLSVTVSVGLAGTDDPGTDDMKCLFQLADEALYEAKRAGRNRVVIRRCGKRPADAALL